ncbi:hypothetical protein MMMB2_2598 [Mycobacterium marinum MB2]|nr:hypothetical protein MMEU_2083 [Mycobacterium marinum str. Europe]EPQ77936.1 hypothetical protein MMMB2_2598 [Mycobacterium marinum MB2]
MRILNISNSFPGWGVWLNGARVVDTEELGPNGCIAVLRSPPTR